jgi:hypothetical protein
MARQEIDSSHTSQAEKSFSAPIICSIYNAAAISNLIAILIVIAKVRSIPEEKAGAIADWMTVRCKAAHPLPSRLLLAVTCQLSAVIFAGPAQGRLVSTAPGVCTFLFHRRAGC